MKKRLITSALPYVNNIPHLGNLTQVLSADVFARFCRSRGYETLYICGTDEYGTASETRALQEGVTPRQLCDHYYAIHKAIYEWFNISFDHFGRTSTPLHTEITQHIFHELDKNGFILEKETEQLYCPQCGRFLADRFVSGTCPHCHEDARGDQCEHCGTLLDPTELIEPKCSVCGHTPEPRKTTNLYINLPKLQQMHQAWMEKASVEGFWAKNAVQITTAWLKEGLMERCITRDLKWGIPVNKPGYEDKVFYVWFDAPIGYISITANLTKDWERWWRDPDNTELFQFIGKDNIPFHTVIFPCSQLGTKETWTKLYHMSSTEYLNYEGGKFSKSKGIGIFGNDVEATGIPADAWRFYMFYNRPEKGDFVFTWADFQDKINKELIGNLSNLVNRTLTFVARFYGGSMGEGEFDEDLKQKIQAEEQKITGMLERADEKDAIREIFQLSDVGNKAFQEGEPWKARKENPEKAEKLLRTLLYLIRDLGIMVTPYMPSTGKKILAFTGNGELGWDAVGNFQGPVAVTNPELLFQKLEDAYVAELRERFSGSQKEREAKEAKQEEEKKMEETGMKEKFARQVTLKASKIVKVEKHPGGDKLYILTLDCGETEERVIVSSIVPFYKAEELLGHTIVLVSNLKPANFRGVKSRGMLLAASDPADDSHSTCEVIFCDDIPAGTVLKYDGEGETEKVTTYVKPDNFFSMPMKTIDGYVTIEGSKIGADGKWLKVSKYVNGNVG